MLILWKSVILQIRAPSIPDSNALLRALDTGYAVRRLQPRKACCRPLKGRGLRSGDDLEVGALAGEGPEEGLAWAF